MRSFFSVSIILMFLQVPGAMALDVTPDDSSREGLYLEMGAGNDPDTLGGEVGLFGYPGNHVSFRAGLAGLASESFDDFFAGAGIGIRFNLFRPGTIISPFIGVGLFGGYSKKQVRADDDGEDNDEDGEVDEEGEEDSVIDNVIATLFPEAGVQIWLTNKSRLTLSGKYNYTTEGRDTDFWQFNAGMAWVF